MRRYPREEVAEAEDPFAPPAEVLVCPASGLACTSEHGSIWCEIGGCEHDRRDPTRFGDN
ncbi:MAG TPA: hypothetical protein VEB20_10365 [Azospirillaceae bacterium]|nr:hypothetical protein [Azospirillaceae bacterium]